ncbi:MAG: ATP-binding protein [Chloroflexota bacterium]
MSVHNLLARQLKKLEINPHRPPTTEEWEQLLKMVSNTYSHAESANRELHTANRNLEQRIDNHLLPGTDTRDLLGVMFETMGDGMCTLDKDGRLILMNPQVKKLLGWSQNEVYGEFLLDAIYPINSGPLSPTQNLFIKLQNTGEIDVPEAIFRTKSGHILNVSFSLSAIQHRGQFAGAVLVFRDISSILHTQAELSHQLDQTLLLNRVIGALTSSLEINKILETLCRELCSFLVLPHAAFALVEKPSNTMKIVAEFIADDGPPTLGKIIRLQDQRIRESVFNSHTPLFLSGQTDDENITLREFDLSRGTVSLMIIPLQVRGEVVGTLGLNAVTPRHFDEVEIDLVQNIAAVAGRALENAVLYRDLQRELKHKEAFQQELELAKDEAENANTFKSQLLAKVSHELRTPLASILGFSEMLDIGVYGKMPTDQLEVIRQIIRSTEYLVMLVNDLLDISRLEAGKLNLVQAEFSVHDLIDRIERDMRRVAVKKGLNLRIFLDQELPKTIFGDIDRVHQVLNNLIENAIKYTEEGQVEVHLRHCGNDAWSIIVRDTGIGIPYEMQEKIFDHFQQANLANYQQALNGFGLGLAIVKQLIQLMDGEIKLESAPGQGSMFNITLPLTLKTPSVQHLNSGSVQEEIPLY